MSYMTPDDRKTRASKLNLTSLELYKQKRYDEQLALLNEALELTPSNPHFRLNRGMCLVNLKRFTEGLGDLEFACADLPQNAEAFYQRGLARKGLGDSLGAIDDFAYAVELKPRARAALIEVARCYALVSEDELALTHYARVAKLDPNSSAVFFEAAQCARKLERWPETLRYLDHAMKLGFANHVVYWMRSYAHEGLGQMQEALEDIEISVQSAGTDPEPRRRRGELLTRAGRSADAEKDAQWHRETRDARVREVAKNGKFVWTTIVQANSKIFVPGETDLPGMIIFTFQRHLPDLGSFLRRAAAQIFAAKGQRFSDPAMMVLGKFTTNEKVGLRVRTPVPRQIAGDVELFCQSALFYRDYLPRRILDVPFIPFAANPANPDVEHLPWSIGQTKLPLLGQDVSPV